jgi:hypothetical protein
MTRFPLSPPDRLQIGHALSLAKLGFHQFVTQPAFRRCEGELDLEFVLVYTTAREYTPERSLSPTRACQSSSSIRRHSFTKNGEAHDETTRARRGQHQRGQNLSDRAVGRSIGLAHPLRVRDRQSLLGRFLRRYGTVGVPLAGIFPRPSPTAASTRTRTSLPARCITWGT